MILKNIFTNDSHKEIIIYTPPEKALCFIALSTWVDHSHEVHCKAKTTSGYGNLTCFQDEVQLNATGGVSYDGHFLRGIYWMISPTSPLSCCSHGQHDIMTRGSCNDFLWPFEKHETFNTSIKPLTNIPKTPERGSGSCIHYRLSWANWFIASWFLMDCIP